MRLTADKVVTWTDPSAPAGVTTEKVYLGPDPHGLGGFQVAVATSVAAPSRQNLRDLFTARTGRTQVQLVVAVVHDGSAHLFGPDPQAQPIVLPVEQAQRQLQSVLAEPDLLAATERFAGFRKANDSTGVAGFTNSGLFASHHITSNVPKRPDWAALGHKASGLLSKRGKQLVEALGFGTHPGPNGTMLLSIGGHPPRAVAVLLDDTEQFDAKTQRFQLSPVAFGLAVASKQEVPWLVVLRKDQIRLYPGRDGVGVGSKGQAETFFEVDLSTVDSEYAALLPLVFSAEALKADGTADELLRDSSRYASELGARLRERIYDEIVPPVAVEVAQRLAKDAAVALDADGLALAYRVTLRILFRLLFQAYAEDRGLLPSGRNEGFDANSLKTNARRLIDSDTDEFGDSTTIWYDLVQVWNAIDQGNPQWQIPSYNGGLFSTDPDRSPEGALIKKIELPDSVLGPALKSLLIDVSDDGVLGPVDFRSLSVREFGTIYEGLLESSLSLAEEDLTTDDSGAWVPAKPGDTVYATAGSVYFHTASGERKATGSYFTPKVVVDHLIERSIVPALTAHLEKIADRLNKGDAATAAREFFDFRVADLAMGSGHFLVAAVDKIEALMRTFLTEHAVPGVTEELLRLAAVARDALGTDDVAKSEVDEVGLLRRQVARRCIYGLDINPMAVELARLALWIHTFVPGLPMSNLDHGLVNANSLTGIGTIDEALDALQPGRKPGEISLFDEILTDQLASSKTLLIDLANASEANKAEVEEGARLLSEARTAADTARRIFDAAIAARIGNIQPGLILDEESLHAALNRPEVEAAAVELQPAHMPFLFPEVFLRERPGFDVLLGNPPWEKVKVEEHQFWGARFPGIRSAPQAEAEQLIALHRAQRPDLVAEYDAEVERVRRVKEALATGPYVVRSFTDVDLFQAFAWRNWQLLADGGRSAIVLPRSAHSGSALATWRHEVLSQGSFADVCFIVNAARWAFDMEPRWTIGLTVIEKGGDRVVRFCGPFASEQEFLSGADTVAEVPSAEFSTWSTSDAFPLVPDTAGAMVFRQMKRSPRLDVEKDGLAVRGLRELHATDDKHRFVFAPPTEGMVPVYKGDSFNLWSPETGSVYAYADRESITEALQTRRLNQVRTRRSAFYGMPATWVNDMATLPMHSPRIAWRDTARATDSRTCIVALIPPETVLVHQAYYLFFREGTSSDTAYVLGVLSSLPFDWYMRLMVENHATVEIVLGAPVPRPRLGDPLRGRATEIAGRLAAVDDRYDAWARDVGVPVGSVKTDADKDDLIAELDAVVSLLYGLTEDQVEHIFSTFHRGWNYEPRLNAVLKHYREWRGKA
ncbi:Eco57I restriction-modification methylase domain-containing protein [Nocardioides cheoyonin]|uniref:Eco57I restriction-modification methylase domain-containing protein n=1 Tax=Nocardioides cheoyonin TaxID=3156615 RepID=UPI0032B45F05